MGVSSDFVLEIRAATQLIAMRSGISSIRLSLVAIHTHLNRAFPARRRWPVGTGRIRVPTLRKITDASSGLTFQEQINLVPVRMSLMPHSWLRRTRAGWG